MYVRQTCKSGWREPINRSGSRIHVGVTSRTEHVSAQRFSPFPYTPCSRPSRFSVIEPPLSYRSPLQFTMGTIFLLAVLGAALTIAVAAAPVLILAITTVAIVAGIIAVV